MLKIKSFGYDVQRKTVTVTLQTECHAGEMEGIVGNLAQLLKTEAKVQREIGPTKPKEEAPKPAPAKAEKAAEAPKEEVKAEPKAEPEKPKTKPGEKKPPKQPTLFKGEVIVHTSKTSKGDTVLQLFNGDMVLLKDAKEAKRKRASDEDIAKHNLAHAKRWEVGMDYYNRRVDSVEVLKDYNVKLTLCDGVRIILGPDDGVVERKPPAEKAEPAQEESAEEEAGDPLVEKAKAAGTWKDLVKAVADSVGADLKKVMQWCKDHTEQVPRLKTADESKLEKNVKRAFTVVCG